MCMCKPHVKIREQLEGVNSFILPDLAASLYLRSEHLMVLAPCSLLELFICETQTHLL